MADHLREKLRDLQHIKEEHPFDMKEEIDEYNKEIQNNIIEMLMFETPTVLKSSLIGAKVKDILPNNKVSDNHIQKDQWKE